MIEAPTACPSCESKLEWSNDLLYCRNPTCGSSLQKQVEYFASTMKIKGLGPATISKLGLTCIADIYWLTLEDLIEGLGSEKVAVKLYEQIELSKSNSLNTIMPAFGIPLIGKSATEKLSKVCSHISEINEELCKKAGLGEKATNNLLDWLETSTDYLELPFKLEFSSNHVAEPLVSKGVVCISGKLNSFPTKQQAEQKLTQLGYVVKSSMTKDVTILVNESGRETAKTQKARESGVTIVNDLRKFIGD